MDFKEIIEKTKTSDHKAFRELVTQFSERLMVVAKMMTKNHQDAQDVLQESFISIYHKIHQYHGDDAPSFYAWSKKIVVHNGIAKYRRKYYKNELNNLDSTYHIADFPEVYKKLDEADFLNYLYELPHKYRLVISLYALEGYSHEEIGEKLGIRESSSRSLYSRAKTKLKNIIPEDFFFLEKIGS